MKKDKQRDNQTCESEDDLLSWVMMSAACLLTSVAASTCSRATQSVQASLHDDTTNTVSPSITTGGGWGLLQQDSLHCLRCGWPSALKLLCCGPCSVGNMDAAVRGECCAPLHTKYVLPTASQSADSVQFMLHCIGNQSTVQVNSDHLARRPTALNSFYLIDLFITTQQRPLTLSVKAQEAKSTCNTQSTKHRK